MSRLVRTSRRRLLPSVTSLRLRSSWTRWSQARETRRLAKQLERTQALLGLLAQREAKLQVALQLRGLTLEAQALRVAELLADLSTPEQPPPPPEPRSLVLTEPEQGAPLGLPVMHRPEELPEEPMPPAEDQLQGLLLQELGVSTTPRLSRSSES